jgi:hypothetical protein
MVAVESAGLGWAGGEDLHAFAQRLHLQDLAQHEVSDSTGKRPQQ